MSYTYDPGQLATSELYQIRLELQDTDDRDQLLQDEEINQTITVERNFWAAAARCAEIIARQKLRKADVRLGRSMMITYTKAAQAYNEMAKELRKKAMGTKVPYAGGVYVADKQTIEQDTSIVAPMFTRQLQQNPRVGGYTSDSTADIAEGGTGADN